MSKYSGKFDLYDHFMFDQPEQLAEHIFNTDFRDGHDKKLLIETEKDLALYFPYIVCVGAWNKEENKSHIRLSDTDHIRSEELDRIKWAIKGAKRIKARYKREGVDYIPEEVYQKHFRLFENDINKQLELEIIRRVGEGGRQKWGDLRSPLLDRLCRKYWYEDLINKYGYGERFAHEWVWHEGAFEDDEKWVRGHLFDK